MELLPELRRENGRRERMTVRELREIAHCRIIARDSGTGNILFDTDRNKGKTTERFSNYVVSSLWGDIKLYNWFNDVRAVCVLGVYIYEPTIANGGAR